MTTSESFTSPTGQVIRVALFDALGNASPTLRVNAGAAGIGQTLKSYVGTVSIATGATVPLETVSTGKSFIITDIYISGNTATQFSVTINAAGTPIFQGFAKGDTGPIGLTGIETGPSAPSGTAVSLVLGAAATTIAAFMVSGYEQ